MLLSAALRSWACHAGAEGPISAARAPYRSDAPGLPTGATGHSRSVLTGKRGVECLSPSIGSHELESRMGEHIWRGALE
jgi:hypothetical protein